MAKVLLSLGVDNRKAWLRVPILPREPERVHHAERRAGYLLEVARRVLDPRHRGPQLRARDRPARLGHPDAGLAPRRLDGLLRLRDVVLEQLARVVDVVVHLGLEVRVDVHADEVARDQDRGVVVVEPRVGRVDVPDLDLARARVPRQRLDHAPHVPDLGRELLRRDLAPVQRLAADGHADEPGPAVRVDGVDERALLRREHGVLVVEADQDLQPRRDGLGDRVGEAVAHAGVEEARGVDAVREGLDCGEGVRPVFAGLAGDAVGSIALEVVPAVPGIRWTDQGRDQGQEEGRQEPHLG